MTSLVDRIDMPEVIEGTKNNDHKEGRQCLWKQCCVVLLSSHWLYQRGLTNESRANKLTGGNECDTVRNNSRYKKYQVPWYQVLYQVQYQVQVPVQYLVQYCSGVPVPGTSTVRLLSYHRMSKIPFLLDLM
jgi:hypothetical protein